jgi:hypothetical protein
MYIIMVIMHCPVFYLMHNVSETRFCLRLQVIPTPVRRQVIRSVECDQLSRYRLKTETESSLGKVVF